MTTIPMNPPAGTSPTMVHLPDAATLQPNGVFPAQIPAQFVQQLMAAGWTIVISGNPPTHVP